jgi:hypothetical protein
MLGGHPNPGVKRRPNDVTEANDQAVIRPLVSSRRSGCRLRSCGVTFHIRPQSNKRKLAETGKNFSRRYD